MLLPMGKIVRFKGLHAQAEAIAFAWELHGRCKRTENEVLILEPTRLRPSLPAPQSGDHLPNGLDDFLVDHRSRTIGVGKNGGER